MRKLNKKYLLITLLITIIVSQSCRKIIDLDTGENSKKTVLNSIIQDNQQIVVNLTKSKSILDDSQIEYIEDANIILTENGTLINNHTYNGSGNYVFNINASFGKVYKIKVNAKNLEEINSETIVPEPNIFYVTDTFTINYNGEEYLGVKIEIKNTEPDSYYYLEALNEFGDNIYIDSYDIKAEQDFYGDFTIFNNVVSGSGNIDFNFFIAKYIYGFGASSKYGTVYFYLHRVSESYYKYYISSVKQQYTSGSPFAEAVQVYNNVEGGFGIFGSESMSYDTLVVN